MRAVLTGLALLVLVSSAHADEPELRDLLAIGTKALPARDAWERCTASVLRRDIDDNGAAESLAERALRQCRAQESRLRAVLATGIGRRKATTVLKQLQRMHRDNLVSAIEELKRR
jgi:hypothetical protein